MTKNHGERTIQHCRACDSYFGETYATPMAGLRTPLSRVIEVLSARTEGMGLNATARTYHVAKKSIIAWEWQLAELKPTLRLYSLMHRFIDLVIEGDELYTKVERNKAASFLRGLDDCLDGTRESISVGIKLWREGRTAFPQSIRAIGGSD